MGILPFFCFLVGCCLAAPSDSKPAADSFITLDNFVHNASLLYTAKHDIVKIFAPLSQFNFRHNHWGDDVHIQDSNNQEEEVRTVFFVEADTNNGEKTEQGLFVYINGKVTKLLDNGRDAVANNDNVVYFGASDGIYKYNAATNTAEKHGAVTDNIIQLSFYNVTNSIYYLTANHEVYKLNTEATASEKVPQIKDAQAFVFAYDRKIYYYDSQKNVYVYDHETDVAPKKIEGLPTNIERIAITSPTYGMEVGTILLVNNDTYLIKPDGTSSKTKARLEGKPTAYEPKPTCVQFFAANKKLYELNVYAIAMQYSHLFS